MTSKFPYNPQQCIFASSPSGCIDRYLSKVIISLPTQVEIVDLFKQILIGGFSCVNMQLSFNSKIFCGHLKENLKTYLQNKK